MVHFEGDRLFPLPLVHVYGKLSDISFLVSCLKDVEDVVVAGPDRASWKLHPAFSFIRSTLEIATEILERSADSQMKVKVFSRGVGATATVQIVLDFRATDAGTAVHWSADVTEMTGLLKLVPKGLITSSAGKVIDDTWEEIGKKLA